jgi:hypothetical protein
MTKTACCLVVPRASSTHEGLPQCLDATRITVWACHRAPVGVRMPRAVSSDAICRTDRPALFSSASSGASRRQGSRTLAGGLYVGTNARDAWLGFLLLATLIAVDNLLWRLASWIASYTFVAVTGDLRRDLFRHLTGPCRSRRPVRLWQIDPLRVAAAFLRCAGRATLKSRQLSD